MDDSLVPSVDNNHNGDPFVDSLKEWMTSRSPLWFSDIIDAYYDCRRYDGMEVFNWYKPDADLLKAMFATDVFYAESSMFDTNTLDCDPGCISMQIQLVRNPKIYSGNSNDHEVDELLSTLNEAQLAFHE